MAARANNLLQVKGLTVDFDADKSVAHRALDQVNLSIFEGEAVGLVGESGSGKTVLAHSILGLLPGNGRVTNGCIEWLGRDLIGLREADLRRIRGKEISVIFQDPQASLNPVYAVGKQVEWVLKLHAGIVGSEAKAEVLRLFESVKLRDPDRCAKAYPHELSGGMSQRVVIAMALACKPKLLIADEATSSLDVTTQAEIVGLLQEIRERLDMALLFVSHDLGLVSHLCQRVTVLHNGCVMESGTTSNVLSHPDNNYTKRLIEAARLHEFSGLNYANSPAL
ncbi:MAG: ABC transporter ATP-binding protein [Verrucomicrobiota bacterium]|nr:ABC transporter ATP-binding protein [Verrucomicrobiota bacterium]